MSSGALGGLGNLPSGLERDGHRGGPGGAGAQLMSLRGGSGVSHDRGAIELAGDDEGAAGLHEALNQSAGGKKAGGELDAIVPHVAESGSPGDFAVEGHRG